MANKPSMMVLKESQETFDVELPKGDVNAAVEALIEHFTETFGEDNLVACQVCNKPGPEYFDDGTLVPICPFCGVLFDTDEAEDPPPTPEPEKKKKKAKGKKKNAKDKSTPAKKRGRPKKEATELVPLTAEQEEELNERMERIQHLRKSYTQTGWQIGCELEEINKSGVWATAYGCSSFFEFCKDKLDMSRSGAYKYIIAAREFDEEEFLMLGIKKAELIASAKETTRPKLMKQAREGATHGELKKQRDKLEGKKTAASTEKKSLTLNSRIRQGDIYVPWLDEKNNEPVKRKSVKNKYAEFKISEEVEMLIMEADPEDGIGLTVTFRKIKTTGKK